MPSTIDKINGELNKVLGVLLDDYSALPQYQKWFYPSAMSAALNQYKEAPSLGSAVAVCDAFLKNTWFFQRWFLSLFSFSTLTRANILDTSNRIYLLLDNLTNALHTLDRVGLSTAANCDAVLRHEDPRSVADALDRLNRVGLLTGEAAQANFNAVVTTHAAIMSDVIPGGFLTQARFNAMTQIFEENRENVPEGQRLFLAYVEQEKRGIAVLRAGVEVDVPLVAKVSRCEDAVAPIRYNGFFTRKDDSWGKTAADIDKKPEGHGAVFAI